MRPVIPAAEPDRVYDIRYSSRSKPSCLSGLPARFGLSYVVSHGNMM